MPSAKLSVIVPAYNEESNIPLLKTRLIPVLDSLDTPYEILIIDDGSNDATLKRAQELCSNNIFVLKHKKNLGLGAAIVTGIQHASGEFILTLDSDFSFSPEQIPALFVAIQKSKADCVIGSPFLTEDGSRDVKGIRRALSRAINRIYQVIIPTRVSAISPIFRIYRTGVFQSMPIESTGFEVNTEILFRMMSKKRKIIEVPAILTTRERGSSKLNLMKEIKNHSKLVFKIVYWKLRKHVLHRNN